MRLNFIYGKQSIQKGVMYLHGMKFESWQDIDGKGTVLPYSENFVWCNISLRMYDEGLPELKEDNVILCECEFVSTAGPFETYTLKRIIHIVPILEAFRKL